MTRLPLFCLSMGIALVFGTSQYISGYRYQTTSRTSKEACVTNLMDGKSVALKSRNFSEQMGVEYFKGFFYKKMPVGSFSVPEEVKYTSLDKCEEGAWAISQVAVQSEGNDVIITADVGHGQENNGTLRKVQITLTDCDVFLRCSKFSNRSVSDINCERDDLADADENACNLAQEMGEWEVQTGNLSTQQGSGSPLGFCFHFDKKEV